MDIRRIFGTPLPVDTETVQEQPNTTQLQQQPVGLPGQDFLESAATQPAAPNVSGGKLQTNLPDLARLQNYTGGGSGNEFDIARILNYFGVGITGAEVEAQMGEYNFSPQDMLNFYRSKGLSAEEYNHSSFEQLTSFIDQGYVVQAAVKEFSFSTPDMLTITGHGVDNSRTPPQEYITYVDASGKEQRMSRSQFEEQWARGGSGGAGLEWGYENYMQVIGPPGAALPPSDIEGAEAITGVQNGSTNLWRGGNLLINGDTIGDRFHGLVQGLGGAVQIFGAGVGFALFSAPAQALNDLVEGVPVVENIVQPLCDLWDTGGAILGHIFNGFGSAMDNFGGAVGSLLEGDLAGFADGIYEGTKDIAEAAVDSVAEAAEGVIETVSDLFSGW